MGALLGYAIWANRGNNTATVTPSPTQTAVESQAPVVNMETGTPQPSAESKVQTFTVVGKSFSYTPSEITVNKGDTVVIIFKNESGTHDWKIDEFNAATKIIKGGQEETIQFVADKVGTFEYYCSVGNHREMGMKGNLIVK